MKLIFRKPNLSDRNKINKFLILLKNDYTPVFSDKERKQEINKIYTGKAKAILVLTKKAQLMGYIVWEQYSKNKKYGYIANLGVHPKYRRKGIAIKLKERAFNQIRKQGFRGIYSTTWHKNKAMLKLNKKLGVKIVRTYLDEKYRGSRGKTILFRKDF